MIDAPLGDDEQLKAMVALIEAQARQNEALRDGVKTLEGRLALRTELDVIVAHEVRTPLTVVAGALQTLRDLNLQDERARSLVAMAAEQAEHLSDVVEELMSPQGTGGPPVERARLTTVPLADVVRRALAAVSTRIKADRLATKVPDGFEVTTSPPRLTAIIVNLLENAARYGADGGKVELSARYSKRDGLLRIEVRDHGKGLGGADPETLFEPFVQGSGAPARGGRGVGLYLVRMLARSMGGTATIADHPGGGCVATVELPQRRTNDAPARETKDGEAVPTT